MQAHRRRWVCIENCGVAYKDASYLKEHIRKCHSDRVTERQLSNSVSLCEQRADGSESTFCPLCRDRMTISQLHPHLAHHMEEIALFPLSGSGEFGNQGDPLASKAATLTASIADPQAISISSSINSHTSLKTDTQELPPQNSESFERQLKDVECQNSDAVERWCMTVVDETSTSKQQEPMSPWKGFCISVRGITSGDVNGELLFRAFSPFNAVPYVTQTPFTQRRLYGVVAFNEPEDAKRAIMAMDESLLGSCVIRCRWGGQISF
jgi:hypothetical protein